MLSKNAPPKIACCGGRYDGGKMKLVAGAGETSEPHAFETVVGLEMSKAHLNALALVARFDKGFRPHDPSRNVTGIHGHRGGPVTPASWDSTAS